MQIYGAACGSIYGAGSHPPPPTTPHPISFSNLGIQCVKKKEIEAAIEKKLQLGIDPFKGVGLGDGGTYRGVPSPIAGC